MHNALPGSEKGVLQGTAQKWLSLTDRCPPENPLVPTLSSFLDNFLDELEVFSALTLPADQAKPNVLDKIIPESKEEPSPVLSLPPASLPVESLHCLLPFSHASTTSAAAQTYNAMALQDPIKSTHSQFADLNRTRRGFSDPTKILEVLGDKFVASSCTNVAPLPITLPVIGEEEEQIYDGLPYQKWLPGSQEQDALYDHNSTEVTPKLHIEEEEEEENTDCLKYSLGTPTNPRIPKEDSNMAKSSSEVF